MPWYFKVAAVKNRRERLINERVGLEEVRRVANTFWLFIFTLNRAKKWFNSTLGEEGRPGEAHQAGELHLLQPWGARLEDQGAHYYLPLSSLAEIFEENCDNYLENQVTEDEKVEVVSADGGEVDLLL